MDIDEGGYLMWAATRTRITGYSHVQESLPCQDYAESQVISGCMLCAVADGASTAPLGEVGASIAVESVKNYFKNTSVAEIESKALEQVSKEIKQDFFRFLNRKMEILPYPTRHIDYATTIAFITLWEEQDYFLCGVIGDCMIGLFPTEGRPAVLSGMDATDRSPHTSFITDPNIPFLIFEGNLSKYRGFVLSTDGCAKGGILSFDGHFDMEVAQILFDYLPKTQNPEIWLSQFIEQNISIFTSDDLSMCVIYPEFEHRTIPVIEPKHTSTQKLPKHEPKNKTREKYPSLSLTFKMPKYTFFQRIVSKQATKPKSVLPGVAKDLITIVLKTAVSKIRSHRSR